MTTGWRRCAACAVVVAVGNAAVFVALVSYSQALVTRATDAKAPVWLAPVWLGFSFPGRYMYKLLAPSHPFGFGEHEGLVLLAIAGLNGLLWGAVAYVVAWWVGRRKALAGATLRTP